MYFEPREVHKVIGKNGNLNIYNSMTSIQTPSAVERLCEMIESQRIERMDLVAGLFFQTHFPKSRMNFEPQNILSK